MDIFNDVGSKYVFLFHAANMNTWTDNLSRSYNKRHDNRNRQDRTHLRNNAWARIVNELVECYLHWQCNGPPVSEDVGGPSHETNVPPGATNPPDEQFNAASFDASAGVGRGANDGGGDSPEEVPEARPAWSIHVIDMFGASLVQLSSFIANFDHRERNPTHKPGCWVHERKCHSGAARSPRMLPRKSLCCDHFPNTTVLSTVPPSMSTTQSSSIYTGFMPSPRCPLPSVSR